nr:hypothetical protein GPVRGNEL_GPVRGNEL_CDS_0068 [Caudoviricetes sp.]
MKVVHLKLNEPHDGETDFPLSYADDMERMANEFLKMK